MNKISTTGYWGGKEDNILHAYSKPLLNWIIDYLKNDKNKPIYDFGCGFGQYLQQLQLAGFTDLTGFEGDPPINKVFDNIKKQDLTRLFSVPKNGNCIFLEVAEHIPEKYTDIFLHNIIDACDDKLIMSWATRGQGGLGHINELNNDEVIQLMTGKGMTYLEDATKSARELIHPTNLNIPAGELFWFKNSTLIFTKNQQYAIRTTTHKQTPKTITLNDVKKIKDRRDIPVLLNDMMAENICEIGVKQGDNFKNLLVPCVKHAMAIDIWSETGIRSQNDDDCNLDYLNAQYNNMLALASKDPRIQVIKDFSLIACNQFNDKYFDFIYIDADHTEEAVYSDLCAWWSKLRCGGILSGHDYCECILNRSDDDVQFGVIPAVNRFVAENNLQLHIDSDSPWYNWFILKP